MVMSFVLAAKDIAPPTPRTITLKIVADEEFVSARPDWHIAARRLLHEVAGEYKRSFGIAFRIRSLGVWATNNGAVSLLDIFKELKSQVASGDCDVVLGFTAQKSYQKPFFGATSYSSGYLVVQALLPDSILKFVLRHELGHLLGAVDVAEENSIMNPMNWRKTGVFDEFSRRLIVLNRDRVFNPEHPPLSEDRLADAIQVCLERNALGYAEESVGQMLAFLSRQKSPNPDR